MADQCSCNKELVDHVEAILDDNGEFGLNLNTDQLRKCPVFDLTNGYGICDILLMLDDETFPTLDEETVDEQLGWVLPLLGDLLNVPELVTILPEFVASPIGVSDLYATPSPLSASGTPLSALLTIAEVQALLGTAPGDADARFSG